MPHCIWCLFALLLCLAVCKHSVPKNLRQFCARCYNVYPKSPLKSVLVNEILHAFIRYHFALEWKQTVFTALYYRNLIVY